jgi:carbonic anhydrase
MSIRVRTVSGKLLMLVVVIAGVFGAQAALGEPAATTTQEPVIAKSKDAVPTEEHGTSADSATIWKSLAAGNARFVADQERPREFANTRKELAKGQHPRAIVLTCADSRLSPELIFDCNLGELFVVRTAGNIADPIVLGSMEYAVEHLHVGTIIVLGHEKCGAVAAAASGEAMPTVNLDAIVRKIEPALKTIEPRGKDEAFLTKGIEANVRTVVGDLLKNSPVMKAHADEGKLVLFPAIYRLETGKVDLLK